MSTRPAKVERALRKVRWRQQRVDEATQMLEQAVVEAREQGASLLELAQITRLDPEELGRKLGPAGPA